MTASEAARRAVDLSAAQHRRLDAGDFAAYARHEAEQLAACRTILEWPLADFDAETRSLVNELSAIQRRLCEQFDSLLESAGADNQRLLAGQRAIRAYGARDTATSIRTRAG